MYLGRALRTKETLPDFLKWRRITRPPLVFCGLTGSQRTPGFWGVTSLVGFTTKGPSREVLMTKGREGLEAGARARDMPEGPGMSNLINSQYTYGRHLANFCFTSSSLGLRLGRIPEDRTTKAKLENTS